MGKKYKEHPYTSYNVLVLIFLVSYQVPADIARLVLFKNHDLTIGEPANLPFINNMSWGLTLV